MHRDRSTLTFDIAVHWSLWTPGGPGYPDVHQGITPLLRAGWERA
ncbi:hypothetical protein [Streptomyces benahoarensis]|nr:hypothetical protein [Streptomyces benahoarensis]